MVVNFKVTGKVPVLQLHQPLQAAEMVMVMTGVTLALVTSKSIAFPKPVPRRRVAMTGDACGALHQEPTTPGASCQLEVRVELKTNSKYKHY